MAQLMPLPLAVSCFSKIRIGFTFHRLTKVVLEKGPLNGCVCVCVCLCKDRSLHKCFKYLLMKLSNNINVSAIFKWSLTQAIFETISETTQENLEN